MNTLEQRLAEELGDVADHLGTPYVDTTGLAAAGRRETVRRRAVAGVLAGAAATVVAVAVTVLPGAGSDEPAPAGPVTGTDGELGRPLELPWWGADDRLVRVEGQPGRRPVPDVVAVRSSQGTTLVAQDRRIADRWSVVDQGVAAPIAPGALTGAPVVGTDGSIAYVEDQGDDGYAVMVRSSEGGGFGTSYPAGPAPVLVAMLPNDRALMQVGDGLVIHVLTSAETLPVTGAPSSGVLGYEPRPTGLAVRTEGTVAAAEVSGTEVQLLWETPSDGPGVWSDDGEQYADVSDDGVRFATEAGRTIAPLDSVTDLRVVGWESSTEVVVAQWIADDESVTGLWRCSSVELSCAEVEDAPTGRILLPGL